FIAHGMSPLTPAVVAFDVSCPGESIRRLDMGALATAIDPHQLRSPVIIGVGQTLQKPGETWRLPPCAAILRASIGSKAAGKPAALNSHKCGGERVGGLDNRVRRRRVR